MKKRARIRQLKGSYYPKGEEKMNRRWIPCVFLGVLLMIASCASAPKVTKTEPPKSPGYSGAKSLYEGIDELAQKLVASSSQHQVGKTTVADFIGPGEAITPLGEYISDKVSIPLFSAFPDFLERKQLKQVLQGMKGEHSGYFDQQTVKEFGKMIGVDSMVIGTIEDMGDFIDVTALIIEAGTGWRQGNADVHILKDDAVRRLLSNVRTSTLTITVEPLVNGTVVAGGKQCYLKNGIATLAGIPYGMCQVIIQPQGYEQIHRSIDIRSRTESLSVRLNIKKYIVSFQIIPPDASLTVDGKSVPLNEQGFAKVSDLEAREYSYVIKAKEEEYADKLDTFNPAHKQLIALDLQTKDPYFATRDKFTKKYQQVSNQRDFYVKLWTDKTRYSLGDQIFFYFRAEEDCYLNLVDINSRGEITLLFPNRFHSDNFVRGGVTYHIPGKNYGFTFEVEPPVGTERIYAMASTRPLNIFAQDFSQQSFVSMTRGNTRGGNVRGIGVRLDQARLSAASECVIHIQR